MLRLLLFVTIFCDKTSKVWMISQVSAILRQNFTTLVQFGEKSWLSLLERYFYWEIYSLWLREITHLYPKKASNGSRSSVLVQHRSSSNSGEQTSRHQRPHKDGQRLVESYKSEDKHIECRFDVSSSVSF